MQKLQMKTTSECNNKPNDNTNKKRHTKKYIVNFGLPKVKFYFARKIKTFFHTIFYA